MLLLETRQQHGRFCVHTLFILQNIRNGKDIAFAVAPYKQKGADHVMHTHYYTAIVVSE